MRWNPAGLLLVALLLSACSTEMMKRGVYEQMKFSSCRFLDGEAYAECMKNLKNYDEYQQQRQEVLHPEQ